MATAEAGVRAPAKPRRPPRAKADPRAARAERARRAAALLKQVSDPTRLRVLLMLADSERHVGAICEVLTQSQPAVSHHISLLRHGGLIEQRRVGKNNFYGLTDQGRGLAEVVKAVMTD